MAKQQPTSTVPTATGDKVTVPDGELNTAADPKTANGDEVRKQNGISASATFGSLIASRIFRLTYSEVMRFDSALKSTSLNARVSPMPPQFQRFSNAASRSSS